MTFRGHSFYDDSLPGYPLTSGVDRWAREDGHEVYKAWIKMPGSPYKFYPKRRSSDLARAEMIRDLLVQTFLTIHAVTTA